MNNIDLKNEIIERIKPIISSWNNIIDIYAISFYVYDNQDNPCEPTITLGFNTEKNYIENISNASSNLEARWNYAFWLQNEELVFATDETAKIVKQWIIQKGFPYFTYEEIFHSNVSVDVEEKIEGITNEFLKILISVVKEFHETGFIKNNFKKEIPIIIHELEYYDKIAEQNIEANKLELVQDFVDFIYEK